MKTKHVTSRHPIGAYLRWQGYGAIVMPWGTCYHTMPVMPDWLHRHELVHWIQYQRYGRIKFVFMYLFELARVGYHNNRYEIEARAAE